MSSDWDFLAKVVVWRLNPSAIVRLGTIYKHVEFPVLGVNGGGCIDPEDCDRMYVSALVEVNLVECKRAPGQRLSARSVS